MQVRLNCVISYALRVNCRSKTVVQKAKLYT